MSLVLTCSRLAGIHELPHTVALANPHIVEQHFVRSEIGQHADMGVHEVNHVNVVPHARPVGCGIVRAEDLQLFPNAVGNIKAGPRDTALYAAAHNTGHEGTDREA
eukprot:scaffold84_cov388-Prasinococcus_capsulatus_cf.AAC.1